VGYHLAFVPPPVTSSVDLKAGWITLPAIISKTYVTRLALTGVDLRIAQRLARHSKPELTANIYTDPKLLDMRDAMSKLSAIHQDAKNAG
jgi:hypothetical protein